MPFDSCAPEIVTYHVQSADDGHDDIIYYATFGAAFILSTSSVLGTHTIWNSYNDAAAVRAPHQLPINIPPPNKTPNYCIIASGVVNLSLPVPDDRGLISPTLQDDRTVRISTKSLGNIVEPITRYIRELNLITTMLRERRGSDAQERLMFDNVAPFIEKNGIEALQDIDLILHSLPSSARYRFPYLLGHIEPSKLRLVRACREYLNRYVESEDQDIREGAIEALDHLNAA